ncbi:MAG: PH domain-containing protein [Muribaculaceae bacterium]|nr:PH domain-containing protein [Muribaculaceae bacterium]
MSSGAFLIIFGKSVKRLSSLIFTVVLFNLFKPDSDHSLGVLGSILLSVAICLAIALAMTCFSYFFKKFYIREGNLVFSHGVLNREETVIPLDRIHSLRTEKGIIYRMLDLRGIVFDTISTRQEEIELILSESDWHRLLAMIDNTENPRPVSSEGATEESPASTIGFPISNILLGALCQNHFKGMAVLGSILSVAFDKLSDLPVNATDRLENWLETHFDTLAYSPLAIILIFAAVYFAIVLLWMGRVLLRYDDMRLTYDKRLLTFTCGLFTRASSRFYHDKICTIRIKRNFLEKRFGFSTVTLCQALNASVAKEDDKIKLYGSDSSKFFLDWWIGKGYAEEPSLLSAQSGKGVFFRSIIIPFLLSAGISAALCYFNLYLWLVIPFAYFLISIFKGTLKTRHSSIELKTSYVIIRSGAFAEISSIVKYSNIEVVRIRRSPFSRWTHRVSLLLSTSGTTFHIRSLPESEARKIYETMLFNCLKNIRQSN